MVKIMGTDEAGRGPLIGPMVMAGVMIEEGIEGELVEMGVKDSKLILPARRKRLFDTIKKKYTNKIIEISPQEIDDAVNSPNTNLNWLEADATIEIINDLKPDVAIIDCPSQNQEAYKQYLAKGVKGKVKLIVEHKADLNYPVCGAASILAKVRRDDRITELKEKINKDFGSGYPSDPKTQRFLRFYSSEYPEVFRKSWKSYKKVAQKTLSSY